MKDIYILAGTRTPFTRMGSDLASFTAADLGREAITALITQTGVDPARIDEVIMGCVCQPADAANVSRVMALRSGIPKQVPAMTIHRNCASGFEAITTAAERIQAGRGNLYLVGGAESMSNAPFLYRKSAVRKLTAISKAKTKIDRMKAMANFRMKDFSPIIGLKVGLTDPVSGMNMGQTAELLAREFKLTREGLDEFAAKSQALAVKGTDVRAHEISPVFSARNLVEKDNGVREDSTEQKLSTLKPVFDRRTGIVTAGNSSQITDGAVALLVGTKEMATELGLEPIGRLIEYAHTGCDPERMGLGPVQAIAQANTRAKLTLNDADLIEINEAFSAQVLACLKGMKDMEFSKYTGLEKPLGEVPREKLNRLGGSIALGHPVGATGARLVLTALNQLDEMSGKRALVSACVGGGQGTALWLEKE